MRAGEFLGQTERRREIAGLELVSATHAAGSTLATHDHERPYFCVTLAGAYVERYGRRKRRCGERVVVFHPAGERHSEVHETFVHTLNVQLDPQWVRRVFDSVAPLDHPRELRDESTVSAAVRLSELAFVREPDSAAAIEALVWEILGASATGVSAPGACRGQRPHWLDAALQIVREDFQQPLDFSALARHVGVHPVHLAATFRGQVGLSVGEYRRRLRLEYVKRRLHEPASSLTEIATTAGFSDQSHMTRAFQRYAGVTPGAYRNLMAFKTRRPGRG